jgi:hypothetical protein
MPESNHIFTDLGIPYMDTVTGSFAAQTPAKTQFSPDQKRKLRSRPGRSKIPVAARCIELFLGRALRYALLRLECRT